MSPIKSAAATVLGALAIAAIAAQASAGPAPMPAGSEKCYGVAKAGKNDCKTPSNSCAGQVQKDRDPAAFIAVPAGTCEKIAGGMVKSK